MSRIVSAYYHTRPGITPTVTYVLRKNGSKSLVEIDNELYPYFYIRESDAEKTRQILARELLLLNDFIVSMKLENGILYDSNDRPIKICLTNPKNVAKMRDILRQQEIKAYEADIIFVRRIAYDKGYKSFADFEGRKILQREEGPEPRVCWADIETKDDNPAATLRECVVRSIAIVSQDKEWFICENTERETLNRFLATIGDFDVVCFWNGDEFDVPVLRYRAEENKINVDWDRWRFFDTGYFYSKANQSERWNLDYVANKILGERKVVRTQLIEEMYRSNRAALKEYNMHDSRLLMRIDNELKIFETRKEMGDIAGIFVDELMPSTFVDSIVIRESLKRQQKIIFGSRIKKRDIPEEESEKFIGAMIMKPTPGLYKNVIELDFNMLYNSIIQSLNISPETLRPEGTITGIGYVSIELKKDSAKKVIEGTIEPVLDFARRTGLQYTNDVDPSEVRFFVNPSEFNTRIEQIKAFISQLPFQVLVKVSEPSKFKTDLRGLFPEVMENLTGKRYEYKRAAQEAERKFGKKNIEYVKYNTMQNVYKIALNSFYGSMGSKYGRYYTRPLGESVSVFGQYLAFNAKQKIESLGFKVLYLDTDGLYFACDPTLSEHQLVEIAEEVVKEINKNSQKILEQHGVPKEWTKVSIKVEDVFRQVIWLDAKKRYAAEKFDGSIIPIGIEVKRSDWCDLARDLMNTVIQKLFKGEAHSNIIDHIENIKNELISGKHREKLVISKTVRRNLGSYQKRDMHVKAAELLPPRDRLLSNRINFVINQMEKKEPKVIPVKNEVPPISEEALKFYYWNRQVFPPTERVLKAVGISETEKLYFEVPLVPKEQTTLEKWCQ